jgi:cation transport regulator ChaB
MPAKKKMPSTIRRSSPKAQRTWAKAHDSAAGTYGEGERAHRTAYSALKHSFEKRGDRWVDKGKKGPSDPRAKRGATQARRGQGETFGGVDLYGNTKEQLAARAKKLGVRGHARMTKPELARAIARKQGQGARRSRAA